MTNNLTPQQVLLKAADLIEEKGWCQNSPARTDNGEPVNIGDPDASCFCAGAAICCVIGGVWDHLAGRSEALLLSHVSPNGEFKNVPLWNDHPTRTKQQVVDALRGAAEMETYNA